MEEIHKNDQVKIMKLNQEINDFSGLEEENGLLKNL